MGHPDHHPSSMEEKREERKREEGRDGVRGGERRERGRERWSIGNGQEKKRGGGTRRQRERRRREMKEQKEEKKKVGRGRDKMAEKRKEGGDTWRRYVLMGVPPESAGGTQVRWREEERARSFR